MVGKGQKRKLQGEEEDAGGSVWENQLQSVLDISMNKFHQDQALMEPSLLRSVLINNTLRQVQSEVRAQVDSLSTVRTPTRPSDLDPSCVFSPFEHISQTSENTDFTSWSSEEDFSLSSAISVILKDLDSIIDGIQSPCVFQRAPLSSVDNLTSDGRLMQNAPSLRNEAQRTSDMGPSVTTEAMFSGCSRDVALDKLLMDIDASVLDSEPILQQGFSLTADDVVKYLPTLSKLPSTSSSSSFLNPGQAAFEIQELEHVMDFLMRTSP